MSLQKYPHSDHISANRARRLLEHLANFPDPSKIATADTKQLIERAQLLARRSPDALREIDLFLKDKGAAFGLADSRPEASFLIAVVGLGKHLRWAWDNPDPRAQKWTIYQLRELYDRFSQRAQGIYPDSPIPEEVPAELRDLTRAARKMAQDYISSGWWPDPEPPPLTAFEQLMNHFERMLPQARHCANPDCQNPYFFSYKRAKYCSEKCANVGKAQYKRDWWDKIGKDRRQRKQKSAKRSKR